jgi:hypothetical protein
LLRKRELLTYTPPLRFLHTVQRRANMPDRGVNFVVSISHTYIHAYTRHIVMLFLYFFILIVVVIVITSPISLSNWSGVTSTLFGGGGHSEQLRFREKATSWTAHATICMTLARRMLQLTTHHIKIIKIICTKI